MIWIRQRKPFLIAVRKLYEVACLREKQHSASMGAYPLEVFNSVWENKQVENALQLYMENFVLTIYTKAIVKKDMVLYIL